MSNEETDKDDYDDFWMLNLQEFVDNLEPTLRDSPQELFDMLSSLETTDSNFHKYSFIQQIRDKLDEGLSSSIDRTIENSQHKNSEDILISDISKTILESKEFTTLSNSINENVKIAAQNVTEHLNSDSFDFSNIPKTDSKETFYNDGSVCSTSDGIDFMFMSPDRYKLLAKEIDVSKPLATRINALSILQQVPQTDLVSSDTWKGIRKCLMQALDDNVDEINTRALKFISRLFIGGSSHVVKEYFLLLIENLVEYFKDDTSHMISLDAGLDLGDRRNVLLLRKFRLLNQIQHEIPSVWLRYSEKYVEEMTESLLGLLEIVPQPISDTVGKNLMAPLHFLSLLDPLAMWFKLWMHGYYGRSQILKLIPSHKEFVVKQVECCLQFANMLNNSNEGEKFQPLVQEDYPMFSYEDVFYVYFLQSSSILGRLLLYDNGRKLFSFPTHYGHIDTQKLLITFIEILKACPYRSLSISKSLYHSVFLIVDIFRTFSASGCAKTCMYLFNQQVCDALAKPLSNFVKDSADNVNESLIQITSEIFTNFCQSNASCKQLLTNHQNRNESIIVVAAKALNQLFPDRLKSQFSVDTLLSLLCLCREIYCTPSGVMVLKEFELASKLYACIIQQKQLTESMLSKAQSKISVSSYDNSILQQPDHHSAKVSNSDHIAYKRSLKFERAFLDNLIGFLLTPKGIYNIVNTGGLDLCVSHLYERYGIKQVANRIGKYEYGFIFNQIAATEPGIAALEKSGYISDLLHDTWIHLEGYSNDYKKTVLNDLEDDLSNRKDLKLISFHTKLLSSFYAIKGFFSPAMMLQSSKDESTNSVQQDLYIHPIDLHSFCDFMNHIILLDSDEKLKALYHLERTHTFGLIVLGSIVTCLDSMLYTQSVFNFQEIMLTLQEDCRHDRKDFVLDQTSIKRNEILVRCYLIGGPNERIIPSDCLNNDITFPYPWTLFSSYPVPDAYIIRSHKPGLSNVVLPDIVMKLITEFEGLSADGNNKDFLKKLVTLQDFYMSQILGKNVKDMNEVLMNLVKISVDALTMDHTNVVFQPSSDEKKMKQRKKNIKLHDADEKAIEMMVQYGIQLRLLTTSTSESSELLSTLIGQIRDYAGINSSSNFNGFDWFVSIIFILFNQHEKECFSVLKKFSRTFQSVYMWMGRLSGMKHEIGNNNPIHPIFSSTCHFIELVLQKELPYIYAAFRLAGCPPSNICQHWLRQCFLNFLDFSDILWYISTCLMMGVDYQVYFTVSILKHLESEILLHAQNNDLVSFLKRTPITQFRVIEYTEFMKELELKYRNDFMKDLRQYWT